MKKQNKKKGENPRVVLDANIYLSGLHFGGLPEIIIDHLRERRIYAAVSDHILEEVERNLRRKFHWSQQDSEIARAEIIALAKLINPPRSARILTPSSHPDNRIIDLAVVFKADYLITGDRDLLDLKEYKSIPILTPRQFLNQLEKRT